MKAVFLFIVFGIFSLCLPAQTEIKKGIKQDTIVKTRTFLQNTQVTPEKVAVRFKDTTPPDNYWKFNIAYGMAFGEQTTFNFIPQVSYSRNVFFSIGGGLNYIYYHLSRKDRKEQTHYAGLNAFARITPLPYLIFQVQPEILERWGKQNGRKVSGLFVPVFLAGGGFCLPIGPGSINLLFMFDIIQDDYTPYGNNLYYTLGYSFYF